MGDCSAAFSYIHLNSLTKFMLVLTMSGMAIRIGMLSVIGFGSYFCEPDTFKNVYTNDI